jgi:uncharacterized membrane protein YhhN
MPSGGSHETDIDAVVRAGGGGCYLAWRAACIAVQGLVTLLFLARGGRGGLRWGIAVGALAVIAVGALAAIRILNASHFEGFVLIVGVLLVVEGFSTLLSLFGVREQAI